MALTPAEIQAYQQSIGYISQPGGGYMPDPGAEEPGTVLPLEMQYPAFAEWQEAGMPSNGVAPGYVAPTTTPTTTPANGITPLGFLPVIAVAGLWIVRLAGLIARFAAVRGLSFTAAVAFIRVNGMAILKWGGIAALAAWLIDLIDADPEQANEAAQQILIEMQKKEARPKRRRYTIGHNPRVRTLQRVARHTMRLLKRHDKYIREFFPKPRYKVPRPAARYLSPIEKAAIKT